MLYQCHTFSPIPTDVESSVPVDPGTRSVESPGLPSDDAIAHVGDLTAEPSALCSHPVEPRSIHVSYHRLGRTTTPTLG